MQISPGNTKYWTPVCDPSIKPAVGQWFPNLEYAIEFYAKYAGKVGFDIRRSSEKKDRQGLHMSNVSDDVVVRPPNIVKNKGSGKRLKSIREKVAEKATKAKRLCRTCKQFAHHDSRNCPEA
nr:protein FAR1-RELATED SEQUENCE 5-like [Ipomoea batatas]